MYCREHKRQEEERKRQEEFELQRKRELARKQRELAHSTVDLQEQSLLMATFEREMRKGQGLAPPGGTAQTPSPQVVPEEPRKEAPQPSPSESEMDLDQFGYGSFA